MSGNIVISIPPTRNNPSWFNNFIVSIFYSQYSKELLIRDSKTGNGRNDYIFNTYMNADMSEFNEINIKNILNDFDEKLREILKYIKIEYNLYEYYLNNRKIFTSFVLPKFIYYLGLSSISIEHFNKKNYVGLYDLVKYNSHKIVKKKPGFFTYGKEEISEYRLELDTTKKQNYIRKLYDRTIHPDYITVNKWFDANKENIPSVLLDIEQMNGSIDDDDNIDNIYRLSTTYKNKDDLKIDDKIQTEIIYNGYKYTLDSCIINNYNNDFIDDNKDIEYEEKVKENIVCLNNNNNRIIYSGSHIPKTLCNNIYKFDWVNKNKFQIYSDFPCNIFEGNPNGIPDKKLSIFDITKSNYTLIYVKHEKSIDEEKIEGNRKKTIEERERDAKEKREEKERKEKEAEAKDKKDKYAELEKLKEQEKKLKSQVDEQNKQLEEANKYDIDKITDIIKHCTPSTKAERPEKDLIRDCFELLNEYIKLLKYDESDFKTYTITDYIQKTSDIVDKINKAKQLYDDKKKIGAIKSAITDNKKDNFLIYYNNINKYLEDYVYHIINILSRQNIIKLLKDELKDLPKDAKVMQILDSISKLPNTDNFKKIEDLLSPTDAKISQIINLISQLPNDDKLKRKLDELLLPTNGKIAQILDAISKIPNNDTTKELLEAISKIPDQTKISELLTTAISKIPSDDKTKELLEAISKIPDQTKITDLLEAISKIPDQTNISELLTTAIAKLPTDAKISDLLKTTFKDLPKNNTTKELSDLLNAAIKDLPKDARISEVLAEIGKINREDKTKDLLAAIAKLPTDTKITELLTTAIAKLPKEDNSKIIQELNIKIDAMQQSLLSKINQESKKGKDISLQSEIAALNQQLELLGEVQKKISETGMRDNKQLLQDMQKELLKYSEKDNKQIITGVQDLLREFNEKIMTKRDDNETVKQQLSLLKDIQSKLNKESKSKSISECKSNEENKLLKLENEELKKQIEILKDIQSKCKKQQKEYERCNKHNTLPYKYIKFKEDELLEAIKEHFNGNNKPNDRAIIDFIFQYFEKNNKVMNVYIIEKYMGDIYDVMKIFNKKYNIENVDIKHFYRLLASISIYSKFYDDIKKIFPK